MSPVPIFARIQCTFKIYSILSLYLVWCWSLRSTWTWNLRRIINMDLLSSTCSSVLPALFVKDAVFFLPYCVFLNSLLKIKFHMCLGLYLGLQFDSNDSNMCFYANTMCSFYSYSSAVWLEIRDGDTSSTSFLSRIVLVILGFCFFHVKLSVVLLRSKNS